MPDSDPPSASPPLTTRAVRHKFRPGLLIGGVVAIGLVLGGDHLLRARQNLVSGIAGKTVQQFIPLNELLSLRVERKNTYNRLYERIAAARSRSDATELANVSYELGTFITAELGPRDPRRRDAMLDVVAVAGDLPVSSKAYWALLEPAWKKQLQPQYPTYTAALIRFATTGVGNARLSLIQLAQILRTHGELQLELNTLRALRATMPPSVAIEPSLERLAGLLPAGDPDRASLQADLATFRRRREQLAASMDWYQDFHATIASGNITELENSRQKAPAGKYTAFIASADAILATAYAKIGRIEDANQLRTTLANYDMADASDCESLAADATGDLNPPIGNKAVSSVRPPDVLTLQLQAWRGHLLLGHLQQAENMERKLFVGDLKGLRKSAEDQRFLAQGAFSKLSPKVILKKRSDNLPAELTGATQAWYGQFTLKSNAKNAVATLRTSADFWLTADKCVVVVNADEPRRDLPAATATTRDSGVWSDECIELYFDRDHWFDMFYQIDANTAGTIFDARLPNTGSMNRRQYTKPDTSLTLPVTAQTTQTETGWQMRFVLPRSPLLPEADGAIKFNIRRFRRVTVNKNIEQHQYSWTGVPGMEHRPEQFGWLIIPK